MGANFGKLIPYRAKRAKKLMSEANSESLLILLLLFLKSRKFNQKLPRRIERKRDSIEFEQSENQGQFFILWAFNYF
ncbi:hypothetical protein E0H80_16440 [Acinetobacter sp. ANC 4779]|nr:hypothetical protein E0H80_16440 [Acinetobacter sp. ANC 4779]